MAKKRERKKEEVLGFLGIGLDNKDGHERLTRSEHFLVVGGSQETHQHMQDTASKFEEALDRRGKRLKHVSLEEIADLFNEAGRQD